MVDSRSPLFKLLGGFVNVHQLRGVHTPPLEVTGHEHSLVGPAEHCMYLEVAFEIHTDDHPKHCCRFHLCNCLSIDHNGWELAGGTGNEKTTSTVFSNLELHITGAGPLSCIACIPLHHG